MDANPTLKFCIVGVKCFDLVTEAETPRYLGGIERMLVALGRSLQKEAHEVSFVTFKDRPGPKRTLSHKGIDIRTTFDESEGLPVVKNLFPRFSSLLSQMRAANPDYFIQMGAGIETLWTAVAARLLGKPLIFCIASDSDCIPSMPLVHEKERWFYKQGLNLASRVVAQTESQVEMLKEHFSIESGAVVMPHVGTEWPESYLQQSAPNKHLLWVGRIVEGKRPEIFIQAAKQLPDVTFHLVGASNQDSQFAKDIMADASKVPNLIAHGKVGETELEQLYEKCGLLCCTSELEGFPATFLEAWSKPMPVCTTFDPDGVVAANNLGYVCSSGEEFINTLSQVFASTEGTYQQLLTNCKQYYNSHYTSQAVIPQFIRLAT